MSASQTQAVIVGYARSPFTPAGRGALARTRPDDLMAQVVRALIERTGAKPEDIEDIIIGCAFPEGEQGFNIGRVVGFLADLPITAAGSQVNRWCGSSMSAIHMAAGAIAAGAGDLFVCGGVESMSRVPMMGFNPILNPILQKEKPDSYIGMGMTAENLAQRYQIDRTAQQAFAITSQNRAASAQAEGRFADEIVPIQTKAGIVDQDGCIRAETTQEGLSGLKPAFLATGTVTAGTSSPLTDGASAVLVASAAYAETHNLPVLARIQSMAVAGCAPDIMGIGPVPATRKVLARAGIEMSAIDIVELNEAFAAQALAVEHDLMLDHAKVNLDGGAIALGHPLGASGARITGKAASLLARTGGKHALATMCVGGGQGVATLLTRA
jgi:acetyl-CoA acyltransferase